MTDQPMSDAAYTAITRVLELRTGLSFRIDQRRATEAGIRRSMNRASTTDVPRVPAVARNRPCRFGRSDRRTDGRRNLFFS